MHILVWIADGGIAVGQVAKTKKKKALAPYVKACKDNNRTWRLWNDGWCDGSVDAWKYIPAVNTVPLYLVY